MRPELVLLSRVAYRDREVTGARLHALLALLAGDLRSGCGAARLVDGLWPREQPGNPAKALQILVSRARALLGAEVIVRTPTGYRLALPAEQVDAAAVLLAAAAAARCSAAGDHAAALAQAEAGLALWDGPPGDIAVDDPLTALRAERAGVYASLVRARALALARLGRGAEAVEVLAAVARERPRDEEVLLELLRAEEATAGPAAALARYEAYRLVLREELGADPGEALRALHGRLLQGAAPAIRHGVQHEPNPLLGRDADLVAVAGLLRTSRVVSIVGPGGLGKTRLAHAVGRRAEQRVVHVVALAGVAGDEDVVGEVASVLGVGAARRGPVGQTMPRDVLSGIAEAIGRGPALLVLDNCEHVVAGVAELVRALVSMTRELRVLTTSRARLGLSSEAVYLLPQLDLATTVELFGQRARAARTGVELPADVVGELCRHLDGLPLAVELAAARVRAMSVPEIARRLQDRFALLRGGSRDTPARHHTLHAVVGWSWQLLDPPARAAMRALSVFPAGFTVAAAARLLDGDTADGGALDTVEHLADQSLLTVADTPSGIRLRMLETVREFAAAQREEAGEAGPVTDRFLGWAREFGLAHHDAGFRADPAPAMDRVRAEQDNLTYAVRLGVARGDGPTVAAATATLAALWTVESNYRKMAALGRETSWLLSHFRPEPAFVEVARTAAALYTSYAFTMHGPRAIRSLVVLRRLPPAPPDTLVRAAAVVLLAAPDPDLGRLLALCDSDQPLVAGVASGVASYLWEAAGDPDGALKAAQRMVEVFEHCPFPLARIVAPSRLAELHMQAGRGTEAMRPLLAALREQDALPNWPDIGVRWGMALVSLQAGAFDEVERWLELAGNASDDQYASRSVDLAMRAELMLARGEVETGLGLWRRAVELRTSDELLDAQFEPGLEPWTLELCAVAVVAHARHGRLDLVEDLVADLVGTLPVLLAGPSERTVFTGFPLCGTLILALAMTDLARAERTGEAHAFRSGARLVALAERFGYLRQLQPTMSADRAREAAERADRSAYAEAVSSYADLTTDQLRAAALALLRHRP